MKIEVISNPAPSSWPELCRRPVFDFSELQMTVREIMDQVATRGDAALLDYCRKLDGVKSEQFQLKVSKQEFEEAEALVSEPLKKAIGTALTNIRTFHQAQETKDLEIETMPGVFCSRKSVAIESVGLYVPGGSAPLFSSLLMLGVPAVIAGCAEIVVCTPPSVEGKLDPTILYSASLLGIENVFKVGGAQAIAAMGCGTESIPRVFKIFGPGNQYVNCAKINSYLNNIAIDLPAGPSEVAVMADSFSYASFIAADLLSQAEHGPDSQVMLICDSLSKVEEVQTELSLQLEDLPRASVAAKALSNSRAVLFDDLEQGMKFLNLYAPEHLIICTEDAESRAQEVTNAGSVFVGSWSPESVGDYASGTNHTLPTAAAARAWSGVSLDSFCKKITFQTLTKQGLRSLGPTVEMMAEAERLQAHKNAVSIRLKSLEKKNG